MAWAHTQGVSRQAIPITSQYLNNHFWAQRRSTLQM